MQSQATTVDEYLAELPEDRRNAIQTVRQTILKNLPKGCQEGMQYGMIGYFIPHSVYPPGYHCDPSQPLPFASLASQKNHMAVYLMCVYGNTDQEAWIREAWAQAGKKLDMGKACLRFKKLEDLPLPLLGQLIRRVPVKDYIAHYESAINQPRKRSPRKATVGKKTKTSERKTTRGAAAKRKAVTGKKAAAKKTAAGKTPAKKKSGSAKRRRSS